MYSAKVTTAEVDATINGVEVVHSIDNVLVPR